MRNIALLVAFALALAAAFPMSFEQKNVATPLKCEVCRNMLGTLDPLFRRNASEAVIRKLAVPLCEGIHATGRCEGKAACKELCTGIIDEFGPMMLKILFENGRTGTDQLCEIIEMCPPKIAPPGPVAGAGLIIQSNLSDYTGERQWPQWARKENSAESYFVHLTDTHLDVFYAEGSNAECGNPICCRADLGPPPKGKRAAGHFGDYLCDLSPVMFESAWKHLEQAYSASTDFVIVTGDEPPHDVWKQSQTINLNAISAVTDGYMTAFKDVPTFFVLGNHAGFPINTFRDLQADSWLYTGVANDWAHWLPADAIRTLRAGGYYAARARPGLRIIALHTTVLTSDDLWLRWNATAHDFTGQLSWLNDTLRQVRELNEVTYIIGHARPTDFVEPLKSAFFQIAYDNRDIIVGYLHGHTHSADLSLMRLHPQDPPFAVAYTAGSLTTETNLNPGYRIWNYTRSSSALNGWDQYWVDLNKANANPTIDPTWEFRYHAPDHFGMKDLSPAEWQNMANRLATDEDLNSKWNEAKNKGGPTPPESGAQNMCDINQNCVTA